MILAQGATGTSWGVIQWFFLGTGTLFALLFCHGMWRDRRRFRNGVYLGVAVAALGIFSLTESYRIDSRIIDVILTVGFAGMVLLGLTLGVLLIVNGFQMLRREGKRLGNLLSLLLGVLLIGYLATAALVLPRRDVPTIIAMAFVAATLVLGYLGFLFISYLGYSLLYRRIGYREGVDYVIVLGSGLLGSRVPPLLASRLDRGIAVFEHERATNPDVKIVTSGGQGPGEDLPEAEAMAGYLRDKGVPDDAILIENKSRTTQENLELTKKLLLARGADFHAVVVTNDFHVFRAATYARRAKLNAQVIGARTARYYVPSATIREFVGILAASLWIHAVICGLLILLAISRF